MPHLPLTQTPDDVAYFTPRDWIKGADLIARITLERAVVRKLSTDLLAAGLTLRVWDGEDWAGGRTADIDNVMNQIMATDEEKIYVYHSDDRGKATCIGSIFLVYGNEGYEVINDYSTCLDPHLKATNDWANEVCEEMVNAKA